VSEASGWFFVGPGETRGPDFIALRLEPKTASSAKSERKSAIHFIGERPENGMLAIDGITQINSVRPTLSGARVVPTRSASKPSTRCGLGQSALRLVGLLFRQL